MRISGTFKKPHTGVQGADLATVGDGAVKVSEAQLITNI